MKLRVISMITMLAIAMGGAVNALAGPTATPSTATPPNSDTGHCNTAGSDCDTGHCNTARGDRDAGHRNTADSDGDTDAGTWMHRCLGCVHDHDDREGSESDQQPEGVAFNHGQHPESGFARKYGSPHSGMPGNLGDRCGIGQQR